MITLVVVVVLAGIAAALLARTVTAAQSISGKAERIATSGRGINLSTDSVVQLSRTNRTALSILDSARPLETQLTGVIDTAGGIDQAARSINSVAGDINA
ncbi:MAG: hypothetical protein H0V55_11820, partial [Thermoleophilaceae bacterium]|nr:hypothetical protein [Thermoleophilaceae bacterium]